MKHSYGSLELKTGNTHGAKKYKGSQNGKGSQGQDYMIQGGILEGQYTSHTKTERGTDGEGKKKEATKYSKHTTD